MPVHDISISVLLLWPCLSIIIFLSSWNYGFQVNFWFTPTYLILNFSDVLTAIFHSYNRSRLNSQHEAFISFKHFNIFILKMNQDDCRHWWIQTTTEAVRKIDVVLSSLLFVQVLIEVIFYVYHWANSSV